VVVGSADEHHILANPSHIPDKTVRWNVRAEVADMARSVCVGKTAGYE